MSAQKKVRVWDFPTRLFHWLLVLTVAGLFATGLSGGGWIIWHERFGFFALGLLAFRLLWGVFGGRTARFREFVRGPSAILRYLKTGVSPTHGHNPLGALSVLAMLVALLVQVSTGLIVDDDIANKGPLADKVPNAWVSLATTVHRMNKWVIGGLVALHLLAIAYYTFVKREKLVSAMVTGDKPVSETATEPETRFSKAAAAFIVVVVAAAVYWLIVVFPKN